LKDNLRLSLNAPGKQCDFLLGLFLSPSRELQLIKCWPTEVTKIYKDKSWRPS